MRWPDELRDNSRASAWLNKLLRAAKAHAPVSSPDIRVSESTHGTTLELTQKAGGGGSLSVQRFLVVDGGEGDNHISCRKQDSAGDPVGEVIYIAKPRMLRVGVWNGLTIGDWTYSGTKAERFATYSGQAVVGGLQPGDKIKEELFPPYNGGEEIFATEAIGETEAFALGNQLKWIDLNADARRYRPIRTVVQACKRINGVETIHYLVVEGGPTFQRT